MKDMCLTRIVNPALRRAVTLTEVTTGVCTVTVLIAMLFPAMGEARRAGKHVRCLANMRQIGEASAIYAAADADDFLVPAHRNAEVGPTKAHNYVWGGKSGVGEPTAGEDPTASQWGTAAGRGPSTRPLNRVIYGDVFADHLNDPGLFGVNWLDDTELDLDVYRCPGDYGYTGYNYVSWRDGKLTSYDHYGNSYAASTMWIGVAGGGCLLSSNSPFLRPASRVPVPSLTLMYLENSGRFAARRNYGIDGCSSLSGADAVSTTPIHGWHGRDFEFNATFVDGHAAAVFIDGHLHPQPHLGRYPESSNWSYLHCVIWRGPDWQIDTLPAPPVLTNIPCASGGAPDPIQ